MMWALTWVDGPHLSFYIKENMIRPLIKKDYLNFLDYCYSNSNKDFYIIRDNKKIYLNTIKELKRIFNNCLKHSDLCYIKFINDEITGILLILKDNSKKYVKILSNSNKDISDLCQYLGWQNFKNLYLKSHSRNKDFVYFNRRTKRYLSSWATKKAGFFVVNYKNDDVLLTNTRYNNVSR